jgi:hypothetical protein
MGSAMASAAPEPELEGERPVVDVDIRDLSRGVGESSESSDRVAMNASAILFARVRGRRRENGR